MFYDVYIELCKKIDKKPSVVAAELGINKSNVSNWKNNRYTPRGNTLQKIADYFGVTTDYLLTGKQKESPAPEQGWTDEEFERAIRDLPKDQLIKLIARMSSILAEEQGEDKKS